jgi:hypothetical protein
VNKQNRASRQPAIFLTWNYLQIYLLVLLSKSGEINSTEQLDELRVGA